jgi:hypothetical protein
MTIEKKSNALKFYEQSEKAKLHLVDGNHIKGVNEKNHLEGMGSSRFPFLKDILKKIATNRLEIKGMMPISHFFEVDDKGEIKGLSFIKNRVHMEREKTIDLEKIETAVRNMEISNDYNEIKPLIVIRFPNGDRKLLNGNHTVGMLYELDRSEAEYCELDFIKDLRGSLAAAMEISKAANIPFIVDTPYDLENLRDQYLSEYSEESSTWSILNGVGYNGRTEKNIEQHKKDFIADNQIFFGGKDGANVIRAWLKHHDKDGCFSLHAVRQWNKEGKLTYVKELKQEIDDNNELVRDGWAIINPRWLKNAFNTGTAEFANLAGREKNPKFKAIITLYCRNRTQVDQINDDDFVNNIIRKTRLITRNMNTGCAYDKFGLKVHFMPFGDTDNLEAMARVNKLNKRVETPESEW